MQRLDELLPVLDEQVALLKRKLGLMQGMADCIGRADLRALEEMLRDGEALRVDALTLDGRLNELRGAMAEEAGLPPGRMTLGRLLESLDGPQAIELADRRERLLLLLDAVQKESGKTAALVRHALEFNQRMTDALLGVSGQGAVYSAAGELRSDTNKTIARHCV